MIKYFCDYCEEEVDEQDNCMIGKSGFTGHACKECLTARRDIHNKYNELYEKLADRINKREKAEIRRLSERKKNDLS